MRLIIILTLIMSVNLTAATMEEECASRIEILDRDLFKILHKRYYAPNKQKQVHEKKVSLDLTTKSYKRALTSIRQLYQEGRAALLIANLSEHRSKMFYCLLNSGSLLKKIRSVAESGGKNLDNFSRKWRIFFPNYVK